MRLSDSRILEVLTASQETIAPAVTQETVVPKRHEEATIAVDKVVHQVRIFSPVEAKGF